jgi:hypothetical protein
MNEKRTLTANLPNVPKEKKNVSLIESVLKAMKSTPLRLLTYQVMIGSTEPTKNQVDH